MKKKEKTMNFTNGIIWKQLVIFALPLLGSSMIQQLYNTVDLIFVGQFLGTEASAAVGASSLLVTCLVGFFTGMSVGASVIVAQCCGSGNSTRLSKALHTSVALSLTGGILLSAAGWGIAPWFLEMMDTPPEIRGMALSYIRIYFLGFTAVVLYNIGSGILRAAGNAGFPMICQIVGGVIHVLLDGYFLIVLEWGVEGVAWSTAISQIISAVMILVYLAVNPYLPRLCPGKLRLHRDVLTAIVRIGVPAGIQAMMITLSNMFAQYHINSFGVDAIAAFTAYFKVELILYLPITAFGQAVTTFVGQNIGAGDAARARQGTRTCICLGMGVTIVLGALTLLFRRQAFGLFAADPSVIEIGAGIASVTFPFYSIYVVMEVLADTIRGAGKSFVPMVLIMVNICGLRILYLAAAMQLAHRISVLAAAYPVTWAAAVICLAVYYKKGSWLPYSAA